MFKKIYIRSVLIIGLLVFLTFDRVFAQEERRSPFMPQFPIIEVIEEVVEQTPFEFFVPQEEEKTFDVSAYNLDGVVWGNYKPKAIINSMIYGVGDILGEGEIAKINKEGVTVIFEEEEYLISTRNPFIDRNKEEVIDDTLSQE